MNCSRFITSRIKHFSDGFLVSDCSAFVVGRYQDHAVAVIQAFDLTVAIDFPSEGPQNLQRETYDSQVDADVENQCRRKMDVAKPWKREIENRGLERHSPK